MRFLTFIILSCIVAGLGATGISQAQADPSTDDRVVTLSPPGVSYIDPEILPGGNLLTYQSKGGIYLAELDPATGLFTDPAGQGELVDTGAARPLLTFNGPEFGIDANGWALFYAKADQGTIQVWRAERDSSGAMQAEPLTSGAQYQTQLASRSTAAETTRIAAIRGTWQDGQAVWFDERDPASVFEIAAMENGVSSVRWVDNSSLLTFSQREGAERGQVALLDTAANTARTITADDGNKTDPYGWFAPEYNGDLLVLAIVDNAAVAVYRDTGGPAWERIATLQPPPESQFSFVSSAEPFVVGDRSYLSLIIKNATSTRQAFSDSEVWLFDINPDPATRYTERCDSGEAGIARSDPEVFIGESQGFVYYNVLGGGGLTPYATRRCRSNLPASGVPTIPTTSAASASVTAAQADPSTTGAATCRWVSPQTTDPRIRFGLEPHYVCHDTTPSASDRLLVFFPGTGADPDDYELFVEEAAASGLHAIGLSYINPRSVNLQICPRDTDPDCHANVRREVIYGGDYHPAVRVDDIHSISNRTVQLLRYLHETQPEAGWDAYIDGDAPRWENIIVAGHSQGAGMAAFIAHEQPVARAVLFAWVDLIRGEAAPWLLESHVTPPERIFYFDHVDDRQRGEAAKQQLFSLFGIDEFGEADVDVVAPPYDNAHILVTAITPVQAGERESAGAHNMVVADDFTPLENDTPVLQPVWRYLLTG